MASLYVKGSKNVAYKLEAQSIKREGKVAKVLIKNVGGMHVIFKSFNIVLSDGMEKEEINLGDKGYDDLAGINFLSGIERSVTLPLSDKLKGDKITVEFKFREPY